MKRVLAGLMAAGFVAAVAPAEARADQCTFCSKELAEGINPLNCPSCVEIAKAITRGNERVWVLDFEAEAPRQVQIKDETGDSEVYWFLEYRITNNDEHPHEFFLDVEAYSDRSRHRHDRADPYEAYYTEKTGIPRTRLRHTARYHDVWIPDVYEEVRKVLGVREGEQLLSQREVTMPPPGRSNRPPRVRDRETEETAEIALPVIRPGETLRCVAIFRKLDDEFDTLSVFVRGLTNSSFFTRDIRPKQPEEPPELIESPDLPYARPRDRPHERVLTEAVLVLTYRRPGDEFAHGLDPIEFVGRRWTDQTRTIKSDLRSLPEDTLRDQD